MYNIYNTYECLNFIFITIIIIYVLFTNSRKGKEKVTYGPH